MRMARKRVKRPLRVRFMRLLLGVGLWCASGVLIYQWFLSPRRLPPSEFFQVCVWRDGRPALKNYAEIKADKEPLCLADTDHAENGGLFYLSLRRVGDVVELLTYNDSMADPVIYAYHIDGEKIIPLWWQHGASIRKVGALFYGIPVAAAIFHALLWAMRRRQWRFGRWFI